VRGYAVTAYQGILDGESVGLDDRGRSSFRLSCCGESHGSPDVEHIYTDEHPGCQGLDNDPATKNCTTVIHSAEKYVRGDVHTNTVEGAFGLFKRAIVGSFHQITCPRALHAQNGFRPSHESLSRRAARCCCRRNGHSEANRACT
jgi:hypothetical protein